MKKSGIKAAAVMLSAGCSGSGRGQTAQNTAAADTGTQASADEATTHAADVIFEEAEVKEIDEDQPTGTIKILIYYDLAGASEDLVDLFETRYGGSIEQEICGSGTAYFERLGTLVAADLYPDITRYEWASFPHGISRNMYTPIDSYIDLDSDLWKGMKDIAEEYAYNGKHYYVPYTLSSNFAINYNRLVLQEYGLPDPLDLYRNGEWTWDTFRDLLVKWCDVSPDHIGCTGVGAMSFVATTGTKYYPKCPECKYSYIENNTDELTVCPNCGTARKVRFNAYYSEEQYDLLQDMITPENGKFVMLFDNVNGFNADLSAIFQGGDESLLDGPLYGNASFTQLREPYYNSIETILDDYREKLKNS